ncbi:hypothetical protein GJ496_002170 [Pomphorhynchus laevis]|nr:hypothetical protein GJ496_002170 [Pomphorhynchus laevis]
MGNNKSSCCKYRPTMMMTCGQGGYGGHCGCHGGYQNFYGCHNHGCCGGGMCFQPAFVPNCRKGGCSIKMGCGQSSCCYYKQAYVCGGGCGGGCGCMQTAFIPCCRRHTCGGGGC